MCRVRVRGGFDVGSGNGVSGRSETIKSACRRKESRVPGRLIVGSNRGYRLASPRPSSTHSSAAILQQWLSDDGASGWH